jgi:hypothetical protein
MPWSLRLISRPALNRNVHERRHALDVDCGLEIAGFLEAEQCGQEFLRECLAELIQLTNVAVVKTPRRGQPILREGELLLQRQKVGVGAELGIVLDDSE